MAGMFHTDVPSANKQTESWMGCGLRRKQRREVEVGWSDEMRRSRARGKLNSRTRACLFS